MPRRDGPPGRLYKFAGPREIPIFVAASPVQHSFICVPRAIKKGFDVASRLGRREMRPPDVQARHVVFDLGLCDKALRISGLDDVSQAGLVTRACALLGFLGGLELHRSVFADTHGRLDEAVRSFFLSPQGLECLLVARLLGLLDARLGPVPCAHAENVESWKSNGKSSGPIRDVGKEAFVRLETPIDQCSAAPSVHSHLIAESRVVGSFQRA